jgi:E3 ubiquitin-protein ligase synoviolin
MVAMVAVKYGLHTFDINLDNPWEEKAVFLLYAELAVGFVRVILDMFMLIMIRVSFKCLSSHEIWQTIRPKRRPQTQQQELHLLLPLPR